MRGIRLGNKERDEDKILGRAKREEKGEKGRM